MTQVLSYADAHAGSRLRHEAGPQGGRIVVPAARSIVTLAVLGALSLALVLAGCFGCVIPAPRFVGGVASIVGVGGVLLFGFVAFRLALPGSERAAEFSYSRRPDGRVGELRARVFLAGDPLPQRVRWDAAAIDDVRVGFARGFDDGGLPTMELVVSAADRDPVGLIPPRRDPPTLYSLAMTLRSVLGLPPPRAGRVAWLRGRAARSAPPAPGTRPSASDAPDGIGAGEVPSAPAATAAVPVLGYHEPTGTRVGSMLDRAEVTPERLLLTLWRHDGFDHGPVRVELTPDRLAVTAGESPAGPAAAAHEWPCDEVYGAYVNYDGQHGPAALCVLSPVGITRLFAGARPGALRELADLLNRALGVPGSAY